MITKFRAWHKELKQMREVDTIYIALSSVFISPSFYKEGYSPAYFKFDEIELMQFTGLTLNGIDIYEGDVIKSKDNPIPRQVLWSDKEFMFVSQLLPNGWYNGLGECRDKDFKVIGNIWQNPELLS